MAAPLIAIIGCGDVGDGAARRLLAAGWRVVGVKRRPSTESRPYPMIAGDAADRDTLETVERRWGRPAVVAMTANPGLRGGGDNHLSAVVGTIDRCWPRARLIATSSTAVYGDAGGRRIDEQGPLADHPRARALRSIEDAVLTREDALVLRAGALGSRRRAARSERLRSGRVLVRGSPQRSLSWIHEGDLSALVARACSGGLGTGVFNATAPEWPSVASFHRRQASELGWRVVVEGDERDVPERRVASPRLAQRLGREWTWRYWWE